MQSMWGGLAVPPSQSPTFTFSTRDNVGFHVRRTVQPERGGAGSRVSAAEPMKETREQEETQSSAREGADRSAATMFLTANR